MTNYPWAANKEKLQRAISVAGAGASESAVKEQYIKLLGLVLDITIASETPVPEPSAKPKRGRKKAK